MKNRHKNIILGLGGLLIISIIGGVIFYFFHKDDAQETLYLAPQQYLNKNVYLQNYYDRKALDAIMKDKRNVADVVKYFGKPSAVYDKRQPDISGDFSGIFGYGYNPQTYDANKQKQCGKGLMITFSHGIACDWDVIENGIEIPAITFEEAGWLLHKGMSMEQVRELWGEPSVIAHNNQMISSYKYYFEHTIANTDSIEPYIPSSIIVFFDSNGNVENFMSACP